eukprot:TRINITY_DN21925_c0_g3_i1.p1 TRINITY_DN21925_c0_g3~~TRINITY_DN21925_c0_g3_i1.p1  ORF type:complete len:699 (-),score=178.74 TRINITY_DN21925_c0_g3_i1:61-2103(-)
MGAATSAFCGMLSGGRGGPTQEGYGPPPEPCAAPVYAAQPVFGAPPQGFGGVAVAQAVPITGVGAGGAPVAQAVPVGHPGGVPMAVAHAVPLPTTPEFGQAALVRNSGEMPVAVAQAVPIQHAGEMPMAVAQAVPAMPVLGQTVPVQNANGLPVAVAQAVPIEASAPPQRPSLTTVSQLTGRRRSVLVGINYFGTSSELNGCINDVTRMLPLLESMGFPAQPDSQLVLTDDGRAQQPTKANMVAALRWLVADARPGDSFFFHYSGHGGRDPCPKEEAASGYHETLCPVDYQSAGQLLDTELFELLVRPLPSGAKLTCLLDCCHSGGVLNLPYMFLGTQSNLKAALGGEAVSMAMSKNWLHDIQRWKEGDPVALLQDTASMGLGLWDLYKRYKASKGADKSGFATDVVENAGLNVGEVIAFTGCRSDQTSADVGDVSAQFDLQSQRPSLQLDHGRASASGGALTSVFIETFGQSATISYLELLERMRSRLASEGFSQVPQFASSLVLDLHQPFDLDRITLPPDPNNPAMKAKSGAGGAGAAGAAPAVLGFLSSLGTSPAGAALLASGLSGGGGGHAGASAAGRSVGEPSSFASPSGFGGFAGFAGSGVSDEGGNAAFVSESFDAAAGEAVGGLLGAWFGGGAASREPDHEQYDDHEHYSEDEVDQEDESEDNDYYDDDEED